jgi:PPP family 3-phenylpropionic acid transporter
VGYSDALIGALWAEGVVAEVVLFAFGNRVVRMLGPERLIVLGGLAATVRWTMTGLTDALPVLVCVQALHALTFGATHLGAMHFVARTIAPSLSATAQSLYSAAVMGLGLGLMLLISGELYGRFGGGAYQAMAAAGLMGGLLAVILWRTAQTPDHS